MFEAHVLYLLKRYLGEYVEGLSTEALRVSVWQGDVVLKDLKLKAEALNSLKLPVTVKAGFVGTITLKVPWKSLGKDPVVVLIDRVFVLAHPAPDGQTLQPEDREKLFQAKLQQIEERENATLEATNRFSKDGSAPSGTWLGNLIATIIGNLKVTISNVHIRYEDSVSNPGHPFCSGITLSKLAAVTVDEQGKETFDTSAALDKLRKSLQLHRLALYHDSDSSPWKIHKKWEDLNPAEWSEIFQDGIDEISPDSNSAWALNRTYLVSPINGVLKYHRLGKQERVKPDVPFEKASLVLTDVSLTVTEAQYYDGIKLLETFSRFKTRVDVSHLRPSVPVLEDPRAWWRYAMLAGLRQKKLCYFVSWERIKHHCQLRRRYVQLYAAFLQQSSTGDASELRQIERTLDSKIIILWRLLAHAKVESVKSQEASRKNAASKRSWWPLGWYSSEESVSTEKPSPVDPQPGEEKEKLTKEEWQAINKLLSFQEEEGSIFPSEKGSQNVIKFLLEVSITKGAARIVSINDVEVICGRFEDLFVETKLRPKSIECDVKLKSCGLSSPEGTISKCFLSEEKSNALVASFVHCPIGQDLDWKLSATIAPCHVTVSMVTYERFVDFVKRSNAISPTIAMETATALQVKLEQVTRKAQEQLQMVLEEQSRFQLDIDLDAPKVWVPLNATQSSFGDRYFILDFGHFKLERADGQRDERQSLYSRFTVKGRDMAVFYSDSMSPDQSISSIEMASKATSSSLENNKSGQLYSFLDPCGMSLTLDQIKVFHPRYPSTRISVEVPKLGLHFSPERYRKITELLDILFYSSGETTDQDSNEFGRAELLPWYPADLTTNARILVWRGIGNSVAEWQPCHLALSGLYLYVLESEFSRTYQRCCSISGRYIFEVPSASVGGSLYAIAVSSRGIDIQKALESTSTLIIEFQSDAEKAIWMKELVQVTYRASASPDMYIPGRSANSSPTGSPVKGSFSNLTSADFVLSGTVVETKLSIYGKLDRTSENAEEELVLGLLGKVATVNLMRYTGDLTIKTKLHSLKIQDMLQSRLSKTPQYLAISVINEEELTQTNSSMVVDSENDSSSLVSSLDEDSFKDALPEFTPTPTSHGGFALPAGSEMNEVFYEATDDTSRTDFVALSFFTRSPDYHLYDGIDTQMSIRMTTLEFYCNRPTVVAMIDFGLDVSMVNYGTNISTSSTNDSTTAIIPPTPQSSKSTIKGLLGYGKGRVVFDLKMDVDQVSVFLNKEDGTQLAVFVQERFLFDLKVHPSSISINGTLGNTRICDMSLGPDHQWGWLCNTKKQGGESLIKFTFQSYSAEDDDYQGYDYSLTGQLSAVRIVFLYRFVQEFTSYFMELASPHTEEAIKLFDKVGGFKGLVQKYEIDGATAVKLDLSLDTPIIIVPKDSHSKDYMQLDLGKLKVKNRLSWHGDKDNDDHSAVHLDILHAEIDGINMAVGVDGVLGKPMVRQGQNMHIEVRRSLRDIYRNVPTMSIEVQIGMLHGVMSDNEYNVISTCITMNLCEIPNIPPSFRENPTGTKESIKILADKVNHNSQLLLSKTVFVIGVDVQYALLELYNGPDAESPLAQIALEGIWVSYRTTSLLEMDLFISIPKFSILDIRPDTKPEMRLMLGSHSETSNPNPNPNNPDEMSHDTALTNQCNLTMLIMDFRWRSTFQSFVIRIQQPRVLVMLDFLLEVVEYFVPSLGAITGREEASNPKNDPLTHSDDIIIQEPVYYQRENIVHLSPAKQLIVDGVGVDEFVYDGCGGVLSLSDEFDKRGQVCYGGTIIMIGAGKRLRFKNVKIENGALLKKCTYLNNGSSYSVAPDDGVEISLLDSGPADMDEDDQGQFSNLRQEKDTSEKKAGAVSNDAFSFNFEAQIVSPELTFYDSSKLLIDDSLNIEKLLRAKLDFSFMYVSKGNDIFSRLSIKDLTVEAGSGLVVLEPMDISGSFSSVKERVSFNAMSTDICIRLSLAVSSLLLKLQNQTISALQFGNINPLVSCTNFEQIWVSPKGDSPGYNLTFWRPQAPPNYAILGDCVTSKPVPPTKVVVAVSNTYGRVRKATGFTLICTLSGSSMENDCSIWAPIPPAGYSAVGCVAHVGRLPPPNHLIYCLRSDLVTSSKFSDCIYYLSPQQGVSSTGFSIWRADNVLNSFHAHNSVELPQNEALDLQQILLRNPNSFKSKIPDSTVKTESQIDQLSGSHKSGSGWDIVRSLSKSSSYYTSTPHFERMWWDKGSESVRKPVSIWRPVARPGFAPLGDCILEGMEPPTLGLVFKCDANSLFSARPKQYTKVAQIKKGSDDLYFWYPVAPTGYTAVGCVVTRFDEEPKKDLICCPRIDLVSQGNVGVEPISRSSSSKGSSCWSIWRVENQASTFLARPDLKRPAAKLAYSISDYVKPKTRENVHAELKLGFLSVSILDSSCGTMTPLLDATVTNINFTSQGRYEAMGAVLLCSIAASTFNRQLEAWEPLIEPFDGIFKLETYDVSEHPPKVGKRVRVAAATPLNVNVTSANLETLIETWVSWNRQIELETLSSKKSEEAREKLKQNISSSFSAINEDDFQKVIIENKLGCDVYFKRVEEMEEMIGLFSNDSQVSLLMPPPRFTDKLNVVTKHAEARYYVAIQIFESEGLPIVDDGNNDDYLCALRLLMDSNVSDQNSLFPQSARTRCVKPQKDSNTHVAKWNELFIFEVPEKGLTHLEVEVTNLGSRAGKGDIIGAVSIPVGRNMGALKRASSIKVFHHVPDFRQATSYPLMTKGQKERKECGKLVLSTCFIERNIQTNSQTGKGLKNSETEVGFSIGLTSKGPWESFGSVLPLSTVPKSLNENHFAFEVSMRNGKKHATLRALAVVSNDSNVKLELSLCPVGMVGSSQTGYESGSGSNLLMEEVFENQRYQPISGWGKIEPWKWSTRDFSHTSKDFFEPPLPAGWKWASGWRIEKSQFVDSDGWAYAPDFPTLKWPPNSAKSSSKSPLDFSRRRRWIRTRQQISSKNTENDGNSSMRRVIGVVNPQSSMVLPWTSMIKGLDLCLQIRPFIEKSEKSQEQSYSWGQSLILGSSSGSSSSSQSSNNQSAALRLSQLKERDTLFYSTSTAGVKQIFWFSAGVDASALHTDLNEPVPDWNISVNSVFRLENKLPFEAEYAIWEKKNDGNLVERQHGIVGSGGCAYVYSADVRKNIYLTMFVQGGWSLEKDVTMIWDPAGINNASSFWMVQKPSKRRLRVSIERDTGRSDAAPKSVRIFVPYWIENDCALPLSYRMVLVEPSENSDNDSLLLGRAVKSAKLALRYSSKALDKRASSSRRNVEILESIEDSSNPSCVMLSPQDYLNRSSPFQSRNENVTTTRVGISVGVGNSNNFSPGVSLLELETKERIDIRAFGSDGSYYRLAAQLKMASDRTKVLHFLPRTLFINRTGKSIILSQFETSSEMHLRPSDPPKQFKWQSHIRSELLKVRVDGYRWSIPFSIESDGLMCISLNSLTGNDKMFIRVQVRSSTKSSRFEVLFLLASLSSPYRIENRSMFLPIRFRQVDGYDDSWHTLRPNSSTSFFWEDLSRPRLLELTIDGSSSSSKNYPLDESADHIPSLSSLSLPKKPLRVTIFKEGKKQITRVTDFTPETGNKSMKERGLTSPIFQPSEVDYGRMEELGVESEFHVIFELAELGVSVVDHMPEEVMYLSVQNLLVSYSSGMGSGPSGISRFKVRMQWIQVDNQLPFSPMPVLFSPQRTENQLEYILKFSMTTQANNSLDLCVYPYIGVQAPENCSFLVNIHEPIIWRLHDMIQHANIGRLTSSQAAAVSVDPIIKIGLLNISEIRFRVSMSMSPAQRPRGALGFWASLMTALGNMEHMPVRIAQRFRQEVSMRQSSLTSTAVSSIQKDLLTQPLQLLSGVDILGNASSALSNMSKGMAALSMDKKFIMSRQKQDSKGVEDFGDVIREGGGALAKGFFRGVTGILTKPLEGAKATGVEGFVSGVGKGLIGAAAQPVSGVLDLLSKTTEGANAVKNKISSVIMAEEQLQRRRLPRVIGGDNLLRPFDEYKAAGQAILQLAECGTFLGQVDLFKVRGKFAFTDAYEDHFMLPKGKVLLVTHRRVLLLQQPSTQRRFNPARDPCAVIWDVQWDDLMTMELQRGAKDHPGSLPSRLILYLKIKPSDSKESVRVIKCGPGSEQASKVYVSVQRALNTYGSNSTKDMLRKKVTKPYTPQSVGSSSEVFPREICGFWDNAQDKNKNLLDSSLIIVHGQPIPD